MGKRNWEDHTTAYLRAELRVRGAKVSGLKADLVQRLDELDALEAAAKAKRRIARKAAARKKATASPARGTDDALSDVRRSPRLKERPSRGTSLHRRVLDPSLVADTSESELSSWTGLSDIELDMDKDEDIRLLRKMQRKKREELTLLKAPVTVLTYFARDMSLRLAGMIAYFRNHVLLATLLGVVLVASVAMNLPWLQSPLVLHVSEVCGFAAYWIFLGVLSSVGLGTGLHTFVLYLGPHIAQFTLAATECGTTNLAADLTCPEGEYAPMGLTFWSLMWAVKWECFLWGAGTALGELPPYFVARAAAASGAHLDELDEMLGTDSEDEDGAPAGGVMHALRARMHHAVHAGKAFAYANIQRFGFFGIMLFASIPNPLFDLAGLTCGHFQVPFGTFFGATLVGKAINKTAIQSWFVITLFVPKNLEALVSVLELVPFLRGKVGESLARERARLHHTPGAVRAVGEKALVARVWDAVLISMIGYFLMSILNSLAQDWQFRIDEDKVERVALRKRKRIFRQLKRLQ